MKLALIIIMAMVASSLNVPEFLIFLLALMCAFWKD